MADQPEALRLADELDYKEQRFLEPYPSELRQAADELRRLHDVEKAYDSACKIISEQDRRLAELETVNESLKRTLAASCDEERNQLWEAGPGGGCSRALSAEAVNRELLEALRRIATVNAMDYEYQAWARAAIAKAEGEQK